MFLLAYLPFPLPGLKSVSQSKFFTSFSSTNLLSYSSSSCTGVRQVALKLNLVPFYKPSDGRFLPRGTNRDRCHFSAVLESRLPGRLVSVTCAVGLVQEWIWTSPCGLVWTCYYPGCLVFWAAAQFGFWLYLTSLAVEILTLPISPGGGGDCLGVRLSWNPMSGHSG